MIQLQLLNWIKKQLYSAFVIIADQTVWNLYQSWFDDVRQMEQVTIIPIQGGEKAKSLEVVALLWQKMLDNRMDKNTLLINIGGGSICDVGGFAAATYKRGIHYVNIPTTLLSIVDASIGGKTAINFGGVKNSIGTITLPQEVFVETQFLQTLPYEELLSGFAELIKYALIADANLWHAMQKLTVIETNTILPEWIERACAFKKMTVAHDLYDLEKRRCLNFGHTIGHALETFFNTTTPLTHGHAIALGMVAETWLSYQYGCLSKTEAENVQQFIARFYPFVQLPYHEFQNIIKLCEQDKKNSANTINCTFLDTIGHYSVNNYFGTSIVMQTPQLFFRKPLFEII